MNGIDIAGHQKGINLSVVPCDFVIVKATQGRSFVNPEFTTQITQALSLGKYVGAYHYANGAGVDIETDHFIDVVKPYLGKVILAIDWENNKDKNGNNDNPKFVAGDYKYCEKLLIAVKEKTGITPFLYMSKSVARQFKWEFGRCFPFWCAQYKKVGVPKTYTQDFWTDTKGWGAWTGCKIFQYSSKGRLNGYDADLDLDYSYMDGAEWNTWAKGENITEEPSEPAQTNSGTKVYPTLRRGNRSEYVRAWQTFLNLNGYGCGIADGIFGAKTLKAVKAWQRAHGLKADGIIGPKTWASLPFIN